MLLENDEVSAHNRVCTPLSGRESGDGRATVFLSFSPSFGSIDTGMPVELHLCNSNRLSCRRSGFANAPGATIFRRNELSMIPSMRHELLFLGRMGCFDAERRLRLQFPRSSEFLV